MQGTAKVCSPGLAFCGMVNSGFRCQVEEVCEAEFVELEHGREIG